LQQAGGNRSAPERSGWSIGHRPHSEAASVGLQRFLRDIAAATPNAPNHGHPQNEATMNPVSAINPDPLLAMAIAAGVLIVMILLAVFLSGPIRRLVIFVANVFCTLVVILTTVLGGLAGWGGTKEAYPAATNMVIVAGSLFGAFLGFVVAAFLTAFLYLLIEIAENSRRGGDVQGSPFPPRQS
jgi:hypothetical protein